MQEQLTGAAVLIEKISKASKLFLFHLTSVQ